MKTINFPTLGIDMEVEDNIDYRDDGVVKFFWEHMRRLNQEEGINPNKGIPRRLLKRNGRLRNQLVSKIFFLYIPQGGVFN